MLSRPPASFAAAISASPASRSWSVGEQDLGEERVGDHRRETVAAQQIHIAVASPVGAGVDLDLRLRAQRARDDRALRMLDGLLGRELALAYQLIDERMIVGQAQQLPSRRQ